MAAAKENCVLTLPLLTEPFQDDILEKRFRVMEHLQNSLIAYALRRLKNLERTRAYRELNEKIRNAADSEKKALTEQKRKMLDDAGISKDWFWRKITPMQKHFVDHVNTQISHKLSERVWQAFDKCLFNTGHMVHFKRRGTLSSIANKTVGNGMHLRNGWFEWNGGTSKQTIKLRIRVAPPKTEYEQEMLKQPVAHFRVVRKWAKHRYKYYLQIILKGPPVRKERAVSKGRVGIDIGTQSVAIVSANRVCLRELAEQVNDNHARILMLQQKMDRSRRAMNPGNYAENGTIRRGIKLKWEYSKHYQKLAEEVRRIQRKNADIRKYQHYCLANEILTFGNEVYVETMNFAGLQRRAKETAVDERGRYKRKKRFGKSLANKAPAMLITLLDQKLALYGGKLYRVNTWQFKASQYDHLSQKFNKKKLSERTHRTEQGDAVQRDLYSAFLLMNADRSLCSTDQKRCEETYDRFKLLHDNEIDRIRADGKKHLSSFGIA